MNNNENGKNNEDFDSRAFDKFLMSLNERKRKEISINEEVDYKEEYYKLLGNINNYFYYVDQKLSKVEHKMLQMELGSKKGIDKERLEKTNERMQKRLKEIEEFMSKINSIKNPFKIKKELDEYIIGQENAKKIVSQAVFNHLQIVYHGSELPEQHLMLIGPSGSGKTEIFRALKKVFNLNVHIFDISHLGFSGYASCGSQHLQDFLKNVKDGDIVVFDEFDKILLKNTERRNDGDMLQSEFLKLLEGEFEGLKNCLFVFLGAFSKITDKEEPKNNLSLGFIANEKIEKHEQNIVKDLMKIGMFKELLGRITYIAKLDKLDENDFLEIIKNDKSIYLTYKNYFNKAYNLNITIEDDLLKQLIKEAFENDLGVRGLNSKIANCFTSILYNFDETKNNSINVDLNDYEKYIKEI